VSSFDQVHDKAQTYDKIQKQLHTKILIHYKKPHDFSKMSVIDAVKSSIIATQFFVITDDVAKGPYIYTFTTPCELPEISFSMFV